MVTRAGVGPVADLEPLLTWLRTGEPVRHRTDFPTGTALPDGRLDLCKQSLGPDGGARVAKELRPGAVRHALLGTDGLGDSGAVAVTEGVSSAGVETLYLGCNGITARGACSIAERLAGSPHAVRSVWLKRNPLGRDAGRSGAALVEAVRELRTLDLVQTGLDGPGADVLADALIQASAGGRRVVRAYVSGNALGPGGAESFGRVVAAGALSELYVSAAGLGDAGARVLAEALTGAPYGALSRLSVASNGIGPDAAARLAAAAVHAGVEVLDLGQVRAAGVLGASDNRVDLDAAEAIAAALANGPHRLGHLVLSHTGVRSREALRFVAGAERAVTATRFVIGKGVATTVRRRLDSLAGTRPMAPSVPEDVAVIRSVYRTRTS